ncbi:MAG: hypothetical protein NZ928_05310 [Endomicrobia bacterium]|nr:hypothetical protein [Endomicrobiia bacterium]
MTSDKKTKTIFLIVLLLSCLNYVFSQNVFEEFRNNFLTSLVSAFNRDLTGVVCSNVLNRGEDLGLFKALPPSLGVDIKVVATGKKISNDNLIIRNSFKDLNYILPFLSLQLEKGLPYGIDLILRYSGFDNFSFFGGGLKYKIISLPPMAPAVDIAVAGFYNILDAKDILKHTSQSANLIISVNKIPVIKPYIVAGIDSSELNVDKKVIQGGLTNKFSSDLRYELGLSISVFPFLYLDVSYSYIYNTEGYSLKLGLKF